MNKCTDVITLLHKVKLATMLNDLRKLKTLKNELATRQSKH